MATLEVNGFVTGGVQVFRNGGFGAVCDQEFGNREAEVACRQLGFVSGQALPDIFSTFLDGSLGDASQSEVLSAYSGLPFS